MYNNINMKLRDDPLLDSVRRDLKNDGCSSAKLDASLQGNLFSLEFVADGCGNILEQIQTYPGEALLSELGALYCHLLILPESEQVVLRSTIKKRIEQDLFSKPYTLSVGKNFNNFMRFRSLLPEFIVLQDFRSYVLSFTKDCISRYSMGQAKDFSLYAALHFSELMNLFPGDTELRHSMLTILKSFQTWAPLYAFTSPKDVGVEPSPGHACFDDEMIESPFVLSSKRADRRFTDCCPQAEAGHLSASLAAEYTGRNTYVFSDGKLLGSLKHGTDQLTVQHTFLAMRTVARDSSRPHETLYPLITGGLYLVSDNQQLQAILSAGPRHDIADEIAFMPLRSIDGTALYARPDYLKLVGTVRERIESTTSVS